MKSTDRFAKTIVFCVDQEHADEMRRTLGTLNVDLVKQFPDYVCRVTSDEGEIGRGHMSRFQDVDRRTPVILTTSQLLTTGLDAPTCKNIVLARMVNSMTEFKQIIGRGTRVRDDYGKLWFNIIDYTGAATRQFADPDFDGDPVFAEQEEIDERGKTTRREVVTPEPPHEHDGEEEPTDTGSTVIFDRYPPERRQKFYFDGGQVEITAHLVYELDADGNQLRVSKLTDYTAERVRTLFADQAELRRLWIEPTRRAEILRTLAERAIDFKAVALQAGRPDADPLDLLCHLAFNAPIRTRRERADRVKREQEAFFERYGPKARAVLSDILEKYAEHGTEEFVLPDALQIPPISDRGTVPEIINLFGGPDELRTAVNELQAKIYAA
jgi:type I restriction enzyme R subunit